MMTMFGTPLGSVLVMHFALLFAKVRAPMRWLRFGYAARCLRRRQHVGSLDQGERSGSHPMRLGASSSNTCKSSLRRSAASLARRSLGEHGIARSPAARDARGRRDGIIPLLGAACMSGTTIHDALLAMGVGGGLGSAPSAMPRWSSGWRAHFSCDRRCSAKSSRSVPRAQTSIGGAAATYEGCVRRSASSRAKSSSLPWASSPR